MAQEILIDGITQLRVLNHFKSRNDKKRLENPKLAPPCDYHQHGKNELNLPREKEILSRYVYHFIHVAGVRSRFHLSKTRTTPSVVRSPQVKLTITANNMGPSFGEQLGGEIVTLTVGTSGQTNIFKVHKALLCDKTPVFAAMFNGNFREATTLSATLPEDNAKAFGYFMAWLYKGTLDVIEEIDEFVGLYGFAEKYNLGVLMDMTVDDMIFKLITKRILLSRASVEKIYANTHEKSKPRLFASKSYAYATIDIEEMLGWDTRGVMPIGPHKDDIMFDCLRLLRGLKNSVSKPQISSALLHDPRTAPPYHYHIHGRGEPCPNRKA
ncbi:hypothetical protein IFR05_013831 [Cadophora sp. M221]|nr:hypothetical protein IFR05_013831 [Cadophora sp. M221]